ncbi:PAS domain-containing protein [Pontibacter cellulosilyticus]|uniref:histidine kinase n=1 Tax=Pontibacter cellulosilyticus TaxID=1720253 RepID=A0A923N8B9_9BACT|nr:PAS domain-containing protein [Pontibacter cellulosilyticus]MBC5992732.1 PAS domain S-box protein [Pontibacter cellulosilyticus]
MHLVGNKTTSDLTLVFRALPGFYMLLSPDFTIIDATEVYVKSINFKIEEIIGKNFFDTFPAEANEFNKTTKIEVYNSLVYVIVHKEAHTLSHIRFDIPQPAALGGGLEERFWKTINTPILNDEGELLYILHQPEDITDIVRLEQQNHQNEERLAMLTNALHTVSWEYDIINDVLTWDERLQQVFGYSPDMMELSGASWDKLVHPDDFDAVQQSIAQATASGQKLWTGEYRFRKADGTYAHVLDQGYFMYDQNQRPLRTFGTIIDLSHNKRAEEELKESDARFRQLLENLPHMAWTADPKGKILYFNDNWYTFTGMPKGQIDGRASVIHPEDTADVITTWHEAIASGSMYEIEYRIRDHASGAYRYFMERGFPMLNHDGKVKLWVGTFTDIEEQRQTLETIRLKEQQLQTILQLSPAYLCLLEGPNHICRYVSPGVYRMYGYRSYVGKPAQEVWPEFEQMGFAELLDQVYIHGENVQLSEFKVMYDRYQNGDAREAFFNFKYQPIYSDHGQVEGVLISAVEVTKLVKSKRKAEKLALELKQRLS